MAEFKVTRELVQELAETGAVQLRGLETPRSGTRNPSDLNTALCGGLSNIRAVGLQIFELSGYTPSFSAPRQISRAAKSRAFDLAGEVRRGELLETLLHQDFSGKGGIPGFSVLWTPFCPLPLEERLYVAGRGNKPNPSQQKYFNYSRGPIVIAQNNFGMKLLAKKPGELRATWHEGHRRYEGGLCQVDFKYDEADREFVRKHTNRE